MLVRRKWVYVAVGSASVLALVSMADARGFRRYLTLRRDVAELEARNAALRAQNEQMVREIEALRKDRAALERAAREELGYVRPGEVVFNVE
ncbi:MAG: septum formation initiator family protein [Myxococcaceae bacterium]|nr:septum formation initiator family protein [Myxococcaceae bacterium]